MRRTHLGQQQQGRPPSPPGFDEAAGAAIFKPLPYSRAREDFFDIRRAALRGSGSGIGYVPLSSFRRVLGKHGALMSDLGRVIHAGGERAYHTSLMSIYQQLAELDAEWIGLICVPDDGARGYDEAGGGGDGSKREHRYRQIVRGMVKLFTERLVDMLTDPDGEAARVNPPFGDMMRLECEFFASLSGRPVETILGETQKRMGVYVGCLNRAWGAMKQYGVDSDARYTTSADCIAAADSLGAWLDRIVQ